MGAPQVSLHLPRVENIITIAHDFVTHLQRLGEVFFKFKSTGCPQVQTLALLIRYFSYMVSKGEFATDSEKMEQDRIAYLR